MQRRTPFLALLAMLITVACEERPSRSTPAPATPGQSSVLDQYRVLWEDLDRSKLLPTAHLYPNRPGLELDPTAPSSARDQLIGHLASLQPTIQRVMQLSTQAPESFPPHVGPSEEDPDAHMRHPIAWFQNFARMLNADAGRCWEDRDFNAAAVRVAASIRLGNTLQSQKEEFARVTGQGIAGQGIVKVQAMVEHGLLGGLSSQSRDELTAAIGQVRLSDEFPVLSNAMKPALEQLQARLRAGR